MDDVGLTVKPRQQQAIERALAGCCASLGRMVGDLDGENAGRVGQMVAATLAMAGAQTLSRLMEGTRRGSTRLSREQQRELMAFFADDLRAKLLSYDQSPLFFYHRGEGMPATITPAGVAEYATYRLEGGWAFQPRVSVGPSDGWAFDGRKRKPRRHDAFCLGGVVICTAWKRPRHVLGPWRGAPWRSEDAHAP